MRALIGCSWATASHRQTENEKHRGTRTHKKSIGQPPCMTAEGSKQLDEISAAGRPNSLSSRPSHSLPDGHTHPIRDREARRHARHCEACMAVFPYAPLRSTA